MQPVKPPSIPSTTQPSNDQQALRASALPSESRALPSKKRAVLLVFCVAASLAIAAFAWFRVTAHFPALPPGIYEGMLRGAFLEERSDRAAFFIERDADRPALRLILLYPDWAVQEVEWESAAADEFPDLPLIVKSGALQLRFVGAATRNGTFEGTVTETTSRTEGTWQLRALKNDAIANQPVDDSRRSQERLWVLLRGELADVDERIRSLEHRVPEQRAEIEKLTELVAEGETLKRKASQKFGAARDELRSLQETLALREQEVKVRAASLEVSQRVTEMGKLVLLARESLSREWRWIDSMLRTESGDDSHDLQEAVQRGEKIRELNREIARERALISELLQQESAHELPRGRFRW